MNKRTRFKRLLSGIAAAVALLVLIPAGVANADVSSGSGGQPSGGGGGNLWPNYFWTPITYAEVWQYPPDYRQGISEQVCATAVERWGLRTHGNWGPAPSWTGHNYKEVNNRDFPWRGNPHPDVRAAAGSGINVVCMNNPDGPTNDVFNAFRVVADGGRTSASYTKSGDYSWSTVVRPQILVNGKDPIGVDNLNVQTGSAVKTKFGALWDEVNSKKNTNAFKGQNAVNNYKNKINAAVNADKNAPHAILDLNEKNKQGMAEGGILNVSENTVPATIKITTTAQKWKVQYRQQVRWSKSGWKWVAGSTWRDASGSISNPNGVIWTQALGKKTQPAERAKFTSPNKSVKWTAYASSATPEKATQKNTGFWQMISVICNPEGMKALLDSPQAGSMGLTKLPVSQLLGEGIQSDIYRTKLYSAQPSIVPLGSASGGSAATKATSRVDFYTKECSFICTNAPANSAVAGDAANNKFDSRGSDSVPGAQIHEPGATDYVKNGKAFTSPRDGQKRAIRVNSWYPIENAGFVPNDAPAKKTLVSRWTGGTPDLGSMFKMESITSSTSAPAKMFNANRGNADTSKVTAATNPQQYSNASILPGAVNRFNTSGNWASVPDKPQTLRVSWLYDGKINRPVPTGSVGFGNGGTSIVNPSVSTVQTSVEGWCTAESKSQGNSTPGLAKEMQGDGKLEFKSNPSNPDVLSRLTVQYIRGTGQ